MTSTIYREYTDEVCNDTQQPKFESIERDNYSEEINLYSDIFVYTIIVCLIVFVALFVKSIV